MDEETVCQRMKMPHSRLRRFTKNWEGKWQTDAEAAMDGEYFNPLYLDVDKIVASRTMSKRELLTQ